MKKLVVLLAPAILLCANVEAQQPIKIGFMYLLSGRGAVLGATAKNGAELAVEEINESGGIGGRKVVAIFEDDQGKPETAVSLARRFAKNDRVDAIIGVTTSGSAEAVTPVATELKIPLIITLATTPLVTGNLCNKYTFRVTCTTDQTVKSAALVAARTNAKKWTTIGPDYLLGHETWEYFQRHFSKIRPDATFAPKSEIVFAPMTTTDWGPYIQKVISSGAEGVVISLWGGNAIDFIKQAAGQGFFAEQRSIIMTVAGSMDVFLALGLEMPEGVWFGNPYWFQADTGPANKAFVARYQKRFSVEPSYAAATAYTGVMAYREALNKCGASTPELVIKALEGIQFESPLGKFTIRPGDHQGLFDMVWGKTSTRIRLPHGKMIRSWDPILNFSPDEVLPPVSETGCKMN